MVGMAMYANAVENAQKAIHQPGSGVLNVLAALQVPPLHTIPAVNDPTATVGQWVKFTAMVQDIWDTEIFVSSSPDGKSGLLVENAAASYSPAAKLAERLPIYLVSLPGETAWVRDEQIVHPACGRHDTNVIPRLSSDGGELKRSRETDIDMADADASNSTTSRTVPNPSRSVDKRLRLGTTPQSATGTSLGLNLPLHDQPYASAVVAKLYDNEKGRQLKINTLVEVVGILQNGLDVGGKSDEPDDFAAEFAARNPNNVKRLHVVSCRELGSWEMHPLTSRLGKAGFDTAKKDLINVTGVMRDMLVKYFASVLYGDMLAAEYLLMCLVSRPSRVDSGILGKLSVNVVLPSTGNNFDVAAGFLGAVRNVFSPVVEVPVNIAGLNSLELFPRKDYTLNRLKAGALQIAPGTCLVGNESALSDGRLAERGVKNVRALTALSQRCMIPVDFQYYEAEIAVDCCPIFVSSGGKSIVPTDIVIRVKDENKTTQLQQWDTYNPDLLRRMRLALVLLKEDGSFGITDGAAREVEKVYVEARKQGQAKDGQESLEKWLNVARCCARTFGESSLTEERWHYAVNLEHLREQRLQST